MNLDVTGKAAHRHLPTKLLLIMKLCSILLLTTALQVSASTFSQGVTISEKKIALERVFNLISKQTGYEFVFNGSLLDKAGTISLNVKNASVEDVLKKCLKDQQLSYSIKNGIIVIKKAEEEAVKETPADPLFAEEAPRAIIKGKVVDSKGTALVGISVTVAGKTGGASTDANGAFTISAEPGNELIFSGVGFTTQRVKVGSSTTINITLADATSQLDDMVVVGYGTQKKKDVTGAVTSLKLEGTPRALVPNINPLEAIQGSAGINVGPSTGAGQEPNIVIRGQNSITSSQRPLIVLDGVIFNGSMNEINMNDIASFDVLKDASSAAIYGSRSANGVIMITTKRGKTEKPQFNFNTYYGRQSWTRIPKMRTGEDYIQWRKDTRLVADPNADVRLETILQPLEYKAYQAGQQIDWFDAISQDAPMQNYQLSVSGKSKTLNYYMSGGFLKQNGVLNGDNFSKPNFTLKLDNNLTDWLQVGVSGYYSSRDYSGISPEVYLATYLPPYGQRYYGATTDTLQRYPTGTAGLNNPYWGNPNLAQAGYYDSDLETYNSIRGTGFVNVKIPYIKGLNYRFNATASRGTDRRAYFHHEFAEVNTLVASEVANPSQFLPKTNGYNQTFTTNMWVMDNLLTYQHSFGDHNFDVLAGYTRDKFMSEQVRFTASDFTNAGTTVLGYSGLALGTTRLGSTDVNEYSNVGYIGRLNYNYKSKYFATANFRRDGASVLAPGLKFDNFPGASVAWAISEESFVKNIKAISYLKLRASYGKTGSQGVIPYQTLAVVGADASTTVVPFTVFGSNSAPLSYPLRLPNKSLSWETTKAINLGLDFAFLRNRITGSVNVYKSKTDAQLQTLDIPIANGFRTVLVNSGSVQNKGIEISLTTVNIKSEEGLNWETSISWWMNRNKLLSLTGTNKDNPTSSLFIGKSLGANFDYTFDGIVQTEDVAYMASTGFKAGDVKFKDISGPDGKPDGKITSADRSIVGYSKENFNFNISNTFSYKNFSLFFAINAIIGGGKNNFFESTNTRGLNPAAVLPTSGNWLNEEYWMPNKQSNVSPRPNYVNAFAYQFWQSRTFGRLQDLSLSYTLGKGIIERLKITDLRLFVSGKNLITITNWTGLDPANGAQIGGNGGSTLTSTNQSAPLMRSITVGLNLGF